MIINSIKDIYIPELGRRNEDSYLDSVFKGWYSKEDILSELFVATQIISPFPKYTEMPMITDERCLCDIFGYRYTHGMVRTISKKDIEEFKKEYDLKEEYFGRRKGRRSYHDISPMNVLNAHPSIHYSYLKPRQDELFKRWKEKYLRDDIVASLLAFDIDPAKFWYVLLWIKDYVETRLESVNKHYYPVIDSMKDVCNAIQINLNQHYRLENYLGEDPDFSLTLRIRDNKIVVKHPGFMKILEEYLTKFIDEYNTNEFEEKYDFINPESLCYGSEDFCFTNIEEILSLKDKSNYKLCLFHEAMKKYLETKRSSRNLMVRQLITDSSSVELVRVDKESLITRLAIVIDYIEEEQCINKKRLFNHNYVKDRIKGLKAETFATMYSNIYRYG